MFGFIDYIQELKPEREKALQVCWESDRFPARMEMEIGLIAGSCGMGFRVASASHCGVVSAAEHGLEGLAQTHYKVPAPLPELLETQDCL